MESSVGRRFAVASILAVVASVASASPAAARRLSFAERVDAQEAIERVYYSHQIGATLPFEKAVPRAVLEHKVELALRRSAALERFWHEPITAEALRAEALRIAQSTRFPARLREIYAALGHDDFLFEECFARGILAERLVRSFYSGGDAVGDSARLSRSAAGVVAGAGTEPFDTWWRRVEPDLDPGS